MNITFKGNTYSVEALSKQTGPDIEITEKDLHPDNRLVGTIIIGTGKPIFAKYEGKYVVLANKMVIDEAIQNNKPLKGKLLSNPVLKRALVAAQ